MFDKKQKTCVKRIHLATDGGLCNRKAFYTVKIVFYSPSMNVGEFMNYFHCLLRTPKYKYCPKISDVSKINVQFTDVVYIIYRPEL